MTKSSLAVKYRPTIFDDLVGQDTVKQILLEEINTNTVKRVYLFTGPAGCGKAQPLYSKVLTPNGYITMGDVEIGTEVFTDKGNIAKVSEIYPQGERDIYEITLQDGAKIRVADNHLNCVYRYSNNGVREDFVWETTKVIEEFERGTIYIDYVNIEYELPIRLFEERCIVSIEYIGKEECQCIMVDHTDHTYISDDFIPTHNTSSGRLFANALESYKSNIIEINAADRTGVDDVREIINQSKSKPLQGLRKIFIIDEVHALSQNAFSALLKLLEEPPAHCIFILCTTDPQKIIGTIMSRVYRYDFQKIAMNVIVDRLNDILEREKSDAEGCGVQTWDKVALEHIAKSSNGGMRTAITTLDKCISYNKNVTLENVISVLGTTSYDLMFKLLDALLLKNELELMNTINEISQKSADLKLFVKHFLELVLDVHRYIVFKNFDYVSIPTAYMGKLNTYHNGNCQYLKYLIAKLIQLNSDLKWESNPKLLIEGSLLLEVM